MVDFCPHWRFALFVLFAAILLAQVYLRRWAEGWRQKQTSILMDTGTIPSVDQEARAFIPVVALGAFVFAVASVFDDYWFSFIAGGFVLSQAVPLAQTLEAGLNWKMLNGESPASGQITFSTVYIYRKWAYQLAAMGTFCLLTAVFFVVHPCLGGAAFYCFAMSAGYMRAAQKLKRI
ncbi:MAG: hypothetical protein Q8Q08_04745 [Candidatus Omnitrophota bacterium]|nr:hypothetical protein [Candidatus Omnitrophota bacterium]MDZ4242229.1 hypothetical protein [Candidatus Omnitrophota bacterium]